jgi:DMSO/TMAO reductase YedYZ molybdopterin-dependent catalytic subunit
MKRLKPGVDQESVMTDPVLAWTEERSAYEDWVTPYESFYIRNHYNPRHPSEVDGPGWTMTITGEGVDTVETTVQDVRQDYTTETVGHVMQCGGNGISHFLDSWTANGWGLLSNGLFTGTPLSEVLTDLGIDTSGDRWITAIAGENPEGTGDYSKSIPMDKAMDDCILAYQMNGQPLAADHGYPIRLIVPGWYGNASVKHVRQLYISDRMMDGPGGVPMEGLGNWHQNFYRIHANQDAREDVVAYEDVDTYDIREQMESSEILQAYTGMDMTVKSLIARPGIGDTVQYTGSIPVIGVAWAGDDDIEMVEISDDGGETWQEAELFGPDYGAAWRQFRAMWDPGQTGSFTLASRATDDKGRTQPAVISDPDENLRKIQDDKFPWNAHGQATNAYMPDAVDVEVVS